MPLSAQFDMGLEASNTGLYNTIDLFDTSIDVDALFSTLGAPLQPSFEASLVTDTSSFGAPLQPSLEAPLVTDSSSFGALAQPPLEAPPVMNNTTFTFAEGSPPRAPSRALTERLDEDDTMGELSISLRNILQFDGILLPLPDNGEAASSAPVADGAMGTDLGSIFASSPAQDEPRSLLVGGEGSSELDLPLFPADGVSEDVMSALRPVAHSHISVPVTSTQPSSPVVTAVEIDTSPPRSTTTSRGRGRGQRRRGAGAVRTPKVYIPSNAARTKAHSRRSQTLIGKMEDMSAQTGGYVYAFIARPESIASSSGVIHEVVSPNMLEAMGGSPKDISDRLQKLALAHSRRHYYTLQEVVAINAAGTSSQTGL